MLAERRIFVTGASAGIGRAVALRAAKEGAEIAVCGRSEETLRVAECIAQAGGRATPYRFAIEDAAAMREAVADFAARGPISGLVHCAAMASTGLLVVAEPDAILRAVQVNLTAAILLTQAVLEPMMRARRGVIVHLSSVAASRPSKGQSVYAATKGALESFTRAVGAEYAARGIRAVCVRPGPIRTGMLEATLGLAEDVVRSRVPSGELGTPEQVASLITYLLSDEAGYVNGSVHAVDGGHG